MSIIRRNEFWPFRILDSFFDDFWSIPDFTLLKIPRISFPRLDIKEEEKDYVIMAEVPGYSKEDIKIEVKNDLLTIYSDHKDEKSEEKEGYIYKERYHRSFHRSLRIPENITYEDISAKLEDGLLTLHIPKKEPKPPKRIEIKEHKELKDTEIKETEIETKKE
ncbi:MAG: Hsp20/alpha crystallin family protein [Promethearchaeota archaeon]